MAIDNTIHRIEFEPKQHIVYGAKLTVDTTLKTVDTTDETADMNAEKVIL